MNYKLNDSELKTMKEIEDIVGTDYGIKDGIFNMDGFDDLIWTLLHKIYDLQEELKELRDDMNNNYYLKPQPIEYGEY